MSRPGSLPAQVRPGPPLPQGGDWLGGAPAIASASSTPPTAAFSPRLQRYRRPGDRRRRHAHREAPVARWVRARTGEPARSRYRHPASRTGQDTPDRRPLRSAPAGHPCDDPSSGRAGRHARFRSALEPLDPRLGRRPRTPDRPRVSRRDLPCPSQTGLARIGSPCQWATVTTTGVPASPIAA